MSYSYDDSTIGQGVLAWFLFNLGIVPFFIYMLILVSQGRKYGSYGFLGKKAALTFLVLFIIEIIIVVIVVVSIMNKYKY